MERQSESSSDVSLTAGKMLKSLGAEEKRHPQKDECVQLVSKWVGGSQSFYKVVPDAELRAWNFSDFGASVVPSAPVEYAALVAVLTNWVAVVDDMVEKDKGRIQRFRALLCQGKEAVDEFEVGVVDEWNRITGFLLGHGSYELRGKLKAELELLFDAYEWESKFRQGGEIPKFEDFAERRPDTAGMGVYLLVLECAVGGPLQGEYVGSSRFRELNHVVSNLACWANDILSAQWDTAINNPINLVRVLDRGQEQSALSLALRLFVEEWAKMQQILSEEREGKSEMMLDYLDCLPEFVVGVIGWMGRTHRYSQSREARESRVV